ncbi:unnamed protein product [Rhizophagus irregularis]|uniref:Serine-threonine/tyrosine-protein kinase catalytic domain-containing protein n=1 Tax=Rhizophagus irregularis TaxID=588596 RepID=A0A915ZQM5_9GLOM|nr:unnamed protein product [Rhizophagus irregularis]
MAEIFIHLTLCGLKILFNQKKLYRYYECLQSGSLADYFGITKDLTSCYMFVMRYYESGNLYSYLDESMGVLFWKDIVDMLWAISAGTRPNIVNGTPPVFASLMLQCLDADPSNRPAASQLYECLGNWIATICDDLDTSDLSNQFDVAEEIKFSNLKQLQFKILPCHEKAIYYSRLLNIGEPSLYGKM